ncbi:MAG: GNAT family N-acetyltransferase [candidate division Zixibacteria bacterium]|nr:GNAT family N-acetyltransferase [candidate division Zixibacteria bacterium]
MLKARLLSTGEFNAWDDFVRVNTTDNLFNRVDWIRYAPGNSAGKPAIYIVAGNDQLLCGVAGHIFTKIGVKTFASSIFSPYNGILMSDEVASHNQAEEALNVLLERLTDDCDRVSIKQPPTTETDLPAPGGFKTDKRLTLINDISRGENIFPAFKQSVRNKIKKAEKHGFVVEESFHPRELYNLHVSALKNAGVPMLIDEKEYLASLERFHHLGWVKIFNAVKDSEICRSWAVLCYGDTCYSWITGIDSRYNKYGVGNKLVGEAMLKLSADGFKRLDFGGANIPNVKKFKESFGGELAEYQHFQSTTSLKGKFYDRLRKLIRRDS